MFSEARSLTYTDLILTLYFFFASETVIWDAGYIWYLLFHAVLDLPPGYAVGPDDIAVIIPRVEVLSDREQVV
jgi:hypothetical protein